MRVNGADVIIDVSSLGSLLAQMGIETRGVAIARNGEIIPRSQWDDVVLDEADEIEIVSAAAGG